MASALLVIDVQKDLFEKSIPIYRADGLRETIIDLINRARDERTPVFFIQHSGQKIREKGSDGNCWDILYRDFPEVGEYSQATARHHQTRSTFNQ